MPRKQTHSDIVLPKVGERFFLDGKPYDVVSVTKRKIANKHVCDCVVFGKNLQMSITLSSKFPFKTEGDNG